MLVFRVDAADNLFLYFVKFVKENGLRVICKMLIWSSDGPRVGNKRFGFRDLFRLNMWNWCFKSDSSSEFESDEVDDVDDDVKAVAMVPAEKIQKKRKNKLIFLKKE